MGNIVVGVNLQECKLVTKDAKMYFVFKINNTFTIKYTHNKVPTSKKELRL